MPDVYGEIDNLEYEPTWGELLATCRWWLHMAHLATWIAILGCSLLASLASGDDYRPARLRPTPQSEPLPASQVDPPAADTPPGQPLHVESKDRPQAFDDSTQESTKLAATPVVDLRPVVYVYTTANCEPCRRFERDMSGGKFPALRFILRQAPSWVTAFPTFHYQGLGGEWRKIVGYSGPASLAMIPTAPVASSSLTSGAAVFAQAAGSSIPDQIRKFLGDEATIVIMPAGPIKTTMDDGSVIKYSKLSAHYRMVNGSPTLTIDQPQPAAYVKKFGIWFEADIQGARGNLGDNPPTATLKTSRGDVRVKIGLEPQ